MEIYPRVFTGPVVKSSASARAGLLDARCPALPPRLRGHAVASEDAFDAAVSAFAMSSHEHALRTLPRVDDEIGRREGRVWTPTAAHDVMPPAPPVAAS